MAIVAGGIAVLVLLVAILGERHHRHEANRCAVHEISSRVPV